MKVNFLLDETKNSYNIWDTVNDSVSYGYDFSKNIDPKLYKIAKDKTFKECKDKIIEANKSLAISLTALFLAKDINRAWQMIEQEYVRRMEKMTGKPFCSDDIKGYLTTIDRCPYNSKDKTFMINAFAGVFYNLKTAGHEIFHLQFHEYFFDEMEKQLGNADTHYLKEALTVLLNIEFRDLWFVEDKGYKDHKSLREFIIKEWISVEKDFQKLLNSCVVYILDEGRNRKYK